MGLTDILLWIVIGISIYFSSWWLIALNRTLKQAHLFDAETALEYTNQNLKELPIVTVIIPLWNEEKTIQATIQSVLNLNYPHDKLEIIIVNDGSTDNSEKQIFETFPQLQKIRPREISLKTIIGVFRKIFLREIKIRKNQTIKYIYQKNAGKGVALNVGITIAKGKYYAGLDSDSYVAKNTLIKMIATLTYQNNKLNTNRVITITPAMRISYPKTIVQYLQHYEYLMSMFVARIMSDHDMIYVTPGPFSLYDREKIIELGGYHEDQKQILTEDQELAYRIQDCHYYIKQCPNAYVYSTGPSTLKGLLNQRNRWFKGSLICLSNYRHMIMNREYGDFGIQQMSINILRVFLSLSVLYIFYVITIDPIIQLIQRMALYHFDIWPFIRDFGMNFNLLNYNYPRLLASGIILLIGILMLLLSHVNANIKIKKKDFKYLVIYFLIYHILMAYVMLKVIIDLLLGRKQWW